MSKKGKERRWLESAAAQCLLGVTHLLIRVMPTFNVNCLAMLIETFELVSFFVTVFFFWNELLSFY